MPIGAKMYESAKADSAESEKPKAESQDKKPGKKDKDAPIEGEVVDEDNPSASSGQKKEEK